MQRKDLALRVLSTAAIMSIVTSIAAPAFADIYYIGNGSIDVVTKEDTEGKKYVEVKQGDKTYTDTSDEIVIKDGTSEKDATLKEAARAEGTQAKPAVAPAAGAATQELEAAGTADAAGPAAGESQLDPDDAFTLSEEEEDSEEGKDPTENPTENPTDNPTEKPTENPTDDPTEPPKKDVVYEYAPAADPNPEQQATKPTLSTSATPAAETREATQANAPAAAPTTPTAPAADPPAEGSAKNPTKNVIRVINNWVGDATKELKIRLSNVNIKVDDTSCYASGGRDFRTDEWWNCYYGVSAAQVKGTGNTKIELDGQNVLDSDVRSSTTTSVLWAGLNKKGNGNLTITDETSDTGETITAKDETDTSGSLRAEGGEVGRAAAIGGNSGQATDNITIEGYATVKANTLGHNGAGIGGGNGAKGSNITIQGHANVTANGGWSGAGIGGGSQGNDGGGDAENITIQDYAKVTARAYDGAAIGSGSAQYSVWGDQEKSGVAKNIVIRGHAIVNAKNDGSGAAIGAAGNGKDASAEVTIGTPGATAETEDVRITAIGHYGSAIGNGAKDTKVTIQGHVTIQTASDDSNSVIGSSRGNVEVNIKDNASIDTATRAGTSDIAGGCDIGGGNLPGREVVVNIDGGKHGKVKIGENYAILGSIYGAISGTKVNIGDNVLLKMLQSGWSEDAKYINVNGAEAEVGTRDNPGAGGLVIGDNTELWYNTRDGRLQKIVHGKNLCKKSPKQNITQQPTCTEPGSADCTCDYEHTNGAAHPSCNRIWTDKVPALGHHWVDNDDSTHICDRDKVTTKAHSYGEWVVDTPATCTTAGQKKRTCTECGHVETQEIPATGHHWVDKGDGTHTCPDCGATEALPVNTNSALELRVVDAEGMNEPFTVSQNGTLRTYTGAYDTATLTGDLNTLRYLQEHGAQTIQFVTNGQTSSFAINDLLAQGSGSEVFYLTHRGTEEPTLLLVEADHSELVKD